MYPWVHQCDNNLESKDQLASIYFPDVNPSESITKEPAFSMVAGDFLEVGSYHFPFSLWYAFSECIAVLIACIQLLQVYTKENEWDCVSTCFFIDCANNILQFIEAIYKILRPGNLMLFQSQALLLTNRSATVLNLFSYAFRWNLDKFGTSVIPL